MYIPTKSVEKFTESKNRLVGGVGSDERAHADPHPMYLSYGRRAHIFDAGGNEYIDSHMGYGAPIQGHCPRPLIGALTAQLLPRCWVGGEDTKLCVDLHLLSTADGDPYDRRHSGGL